MPQSFFKITYIFLFILGCANLLIAQSSSDDPILLNSRNLSANEKFLNYIDTIDYYLYRDIDIVEQAIKSCEEILRAEIQIPDSTILEYNIQKIYYELNNDDLLSSYQIIQDSEYLLRNKSISNKNRNRFNYIKGFTLMEIGDITAAQNTFHTLLDSGTSQKDTSLIRSSLYSLGQLFSNEREFETAIEYFLRLKELLKTYKDRVTTHVLTDYELSEAYVDLGQNDKAIQTIEGALNTLEEKKMDRLKPDFLLLQGSIFLKENDIFNAEKNYEELLQLVKNNKDLIIAENIAIFHGKLLEQKKEFTAALTIYDSLITTFDADELIIKYETLEKAHKVAYKMNAPTRAYQYLVQQKEVNEKVKKKKKKQEVAYLKIKYENAKKEEEIKLLNEISKREALRVKTLLITLFFSLALLLLGGYLYYKIRKNKKIIEQQSKELKKVDQLKSNLFINIAHELRTPLTLISGSIDRLFQKSYLEEADKEQLFLAQNSSEQLVTLSNQILDLTKNNIKEKPLHLERFKWKDFLDAILAPHRASAKIRKIDFEITNNVSEAITIQSDFLKLKTILNNLFQNSYKYNVKGGSLSFFATDEGEYLFLTLKDTGKGIHEADLPFVFDRFYQSKVTTSAEGGLGIGLSICKEYVETLNGTIEINSKLEEGTTVFVKIPKVTDSKVDAPIYQIEKPSIVTIEKTKSPKKIEPNLDHLLIVEDNLELQTFLKSILESEYDLSFAHDGELAIELLENITPSLIITDWIMPNMNGLELVTAVKENPKWASIPILMLTARSFSMDQLKALRKGVDDYIIKPFKSDYLTHRIEYLLEASERRMEEMNSSLKEESILGNKATSEILLSQNEADVEWISNLENIILRNIDQFDFTVENISQQMYISVPHLFRKVKKITGMTPKSFMDEIRFWEARRLLEEKKITSVSSVAFHVGLKSVKHFSKKFKKRFGVNPSEYLKK